MKLMGKTIILDVDNSKKVEGTCRNPVNERYLWLSLSLTL